MSAEFTQDGRLITSAGCNTMQAPLELEGGRLKAGDFATTEMGCDAPRHEQDRWLSGVLSSDPTWRLEQDELVVTSGRTQIKLADREIVETDVPLPGTTWLGNSFVEGEVATSMAYADQAWLRIADGEVNGSAGCNRFGGTAVVEGDQIRFGRLVTTAKECLDPDRVELERRVLAMLNGTTVTYEIDNDSLTLTRGNGDSFGLVAKDS